MPASFKYLSKYLLVTLWITFFVSIRAASAAHRTTGFMTLGDLPGGSFGSAAAAVSADGSVVAGTGHSDGGAEAFRWSEADGMVALGVLPGPTYQSISWGMSADGQVIFGDSGGGTFRWTPSSGMSLFNGLSPRAASADGSVMAGILNNEAVRWTMNGGVQHLGDLPGGNFASAGLGMSLDGNVIVGSGLDAQGRKAVRWTQATGLVSIGELPGGIVSAEATAASADGSVIVGNSFSNRGLEVFRWTQSTGMVGSGFLPGYYNVALTGGVSSDGNRIVGTIAVTENEDTAFVWNQGSGIQRLDQWLTNNFGLNLNGWKLSGASGISADGSTIIGSAVNSLDQSVAFRAVIPEPASVTLCLVTVWGTFQIRRTRKAFAASRLLGPHLYSI